MTARKKTVGSGMSFDVHCGRSVGTTARPSMSGDVHPRLSLIRSLVSSWRCSARSPAARTTSRFRSRRRSSRNSTSAGFSGCSSRDSSPAATTKSMRTSKPFACCEVSCDKRARCASWRPSHSCSTRLPRTKRWRCAAGVTGRYRKHSGAGAPANQGRKGSRAVRAHLLESRLLEKDR